MKQAKFALTAVAVLAIVGGALAFKANKASRLNHTFYTLGATTVGGVPTSACIVSTLLPKEANLNGPEIPYSTTFNATPTVACSGKAIDAA